MLEKDREKGVPFAPFSSSKWLIMQRNHPRFGILPISYSIGCLDTCPREDMKYKIARTWATFLFFQGILQMDMWGVTPSDRWDWDALREMISKSGVRNSLLIAPMPTASTSQILGNNECFEPYTSNIYSRRVLRFVLLYQADFCKVWLFFPLPSNHIHFQRWICCDEQTPPSWFNGDGSLVTCS